MQQLQTTVDSLLPKKETEIPSPPPPPLFSASKTSLAVLSEKLQEIVNLRECRADERKEEKESDTHKNDDSQKSIRPIKVDPPPGASLSNPRSARVRSETTAVASPPGSYPLSVTQPTPPNKPSMSGTLRMSSTVASMFAEKGKEKLKEMDKKKIKKSDR